MIARGVSVMSAEHCYCRYRYKLAEHPFRALHHPYHQTCEGRVV